MRSSDITTFAKTLRSMLLTFLFFGVAGLTSYGWHSWQSEFHEMQERQMVFAEFLAFSSQSFFDDIGNDLEPLGDLLKQIDVQKRPQEARQYLERFHLRHPEVRALAVFLPNGRMVLNSAEKAGKSLPDFRNDPPYLEQFLRDLASKAHYTVGPPEFGKVIQVWRFSLRHVVRDMAGKPVYLVQAAIPLENGMTFLHKLPLPEGSYMGLLRADGLQQARFPVAQGENIYGRNSPGPVAQILKANPSLLRGNFEGSSPWILGESSRMGAFSRLGKQDMIAYVSMPTSYLLHRWWQYNQPVFFSFALFFLLFVAIALWVTRREARHSSDLYDQAMQDGLTGLPNRMALHNILYGNLQSAEAAQQKFAILFIDLDRFKGINDAFGHAMGDKLLTRVAKAIRPLLRSGDVLGRFGGDEFLLVLPGSDEAGVMLITQRLLDTFKVPFFIDGRSLRITPSIGIAIYPEHGHDIETLLKHADTAMYESKRLGRNAYTVYMEQMGRRVRDRMEMEHQLTEAIREGAFRLVYQPLVDMRSGKIIGVEALVRWVLPNGKWRMPAEFIHIAEDSGAIIPLGEWVLRTACIQMKSWQAAGFDLKVAVNLSTRQFQDAALLDKVLAVLKETGLESRYLELEVTESAAMLNPEETLEILCAFTSHGIRIAIDDFGTGYSSLSYLKRIPADIIKIDKMFVDGLGNAVQDATIVRTIIALAHALGKKTVAEGIETEEQYNAISEMGSDYAQGFLIGLPVEAAKLTDMLLDETQLV